MAIGITQYVNRKLSITDNVNDRNLVIDVISNASDFVTPFTLFHPLYKMNALERNLLTAAGATDDIFECLARMDLNLTSGLEYNLLAALIAAHGVQPIDWLLRVEFSTDRGAIGSGTYAGEVGSVTITDTGNNLTVSGGVLQFGTGVVGFGNPRVHSSLFTRAQGLMFWYNTPQFNAAFDAVGVSLSNANTMLGGGGSDVASSLGQSTWIFNNTFIVLPNTPTVNVPFAVVLQSTGFYVFRFASGAWSLIWSSVTGTQNVYSGMVKNNSVGPNVQSQLDYMRARQLSSAAWTTLNGLASVNVSSPASGANSTATADAIHDIVFTLDASPTAGERVELRYRVQDSSNYWTVYMERNVGNTAWDTKNDSLLAGVATNRISVTGVTATRLRVIVDQSRHDVFTLTGTTWTKRGPQINVSYLNTETAINATYDAGNTVSQKISFRRTSPEYAELSRT